MLACQYNQPKRPGDLDLLTLKVVTESRVAWATSVPILVFLGLSVLELGIRDRRQTKASLNAPAYQGRGVIIKISLDEDVKSRCGFASLRSAHSGLVLGLFMGVFCVFMYSPVCSVTWLPWYRRKWLTANTCLLLAFSLCRCECYACVYPAAAWLGVP